MSSIEEVITNLIGSEYIPMVKEQIKICIACKEPSEVKLKKFKTLKGIYEV